MRHGARLILLISLLWTTAAQAQVLWSISDDHGRESWLLGTVHSEDPRLLEFPPELIEALQQADRLALELVPDNQTMQRLQQAMHYDDGGLDEVLDESLYRRVVGILEAHYGMGEPAVRRLRPWAVAMTLSMPPPETGLFMDLALSFRASGLGLEVVALETLDEQMDFLTDLPQSDQIELIRQSVADFPDLGELHDRLVAAYLDGDLERLERLTDEQLAELDEQIVEHFNQAGLVERNRVMLDRARPWLESGGVVIAVGALHLTGEDGLLVLLREAGYRLEPIY